MSRIQWNGPGERFFEAGIDQVVLYPRLGPGVPWNGVVAINEDSSGDLEPLYFDGVKYSDVGSAEDFSVTLEAFASPREFAPADGVKSLVPGLFVSQQPRETFGLCYRTLKGDDLQGVDYGYKLHLVYNCTAAPTGKNNATIAGNATAGTRSWTIQTVPPPATTYKPSAHVVLDSNLFDAEALHQVEGMVYGRPGTSPYLPSVAEILAIFNTRVTELITEFV